MRIRSALLVAALALGACATIPAMSPIALSETFSRDAIAWSLGEGENTIVGNAVLRTVGGDVKTCAGLGATLIAESPYSRARMEYIYGAGQTGFMGPGQGRYFTPDPPEYHSTIRETVCDAQGNFTFNDIPDGDYYATALISWGAVQGGRYAYIETQGGILMQKVSVRGGETKRIVLARQ